MKVKNKKGVSPVIATVLLILLGVSAVLLVYFFIRPYIMHIMTDSQRCFNARDELKIAEEGFACYEPVDSLNPSAGSRIKITLKRGTNKQVVMEGFVVGVYGDDNSRTYERAEFPDVGARETFYIITDLTKVDSLEVSPILEENTRCKNLQSKTSIKAC